MSRSRTNSANATTNRMNARRGEVGDRKRPRSTLEWEFGGEAGAGLPPSTNPRRAEETPLRRAPEARSRPPALQGEIMPREQDAAPSRQGRSAQPLGGRTVPTPSPTRTTGTSPTLVALFQGEAGMRRVVATRIALDDALDRWWTNADLAPLALLRDGLLLLEAGHALDETQRSFLLRSALRTQRGLLTALHHQTDPDRTAFLLKDALLDLHHPLPPQLLPALRREDRQSEAWADYLAHDLAYEANAATGRRSELAAVALAALQGKPIPPLRRIGRVGLPTVAERPHPELLPLSHRWSLRWLVWLLLTMLLLIGYGWGQYRPGVAMVAIPAGSYTISDPARRDQAAPANQRTVTLPAYTIDRTEVTNRAYRSCVAGGGCPLPTTVPTQTRLDYFTNPAYDDFPVTNVDWSAAQTFCAWVGKTLPSLEQWEVAAAIAPVTQQRLRYPWGDRFEARFANSAALALHATQAVGSYQPAGNSLWGVADLAGNVAEWTLMPAANQLDGYVVKGGSFQDEAPALQTDALQEVAMTTAAPWLGFRCVRAN